MPEKWDLFSTWQYVLPPSRPDSWQLSVIRKVLNGYAQPKVAVLGATIEFRDMLAAHNIRDVVVFENNHNFFNEVSKFRKYDNSETVVWGDWLVTLGKFTNCFDIILSDLTSGNIPYSDRTAFYLSISAALTERGVFIDRMLTKPIPFIPIDMLIEKYKQTKITNRTVNDFNSEVLFCSSLLENELQIVDTSMFYDHLLSLNIPQVCSFVQACYLITPRACRWWYSKDWCVEKVTYERYFCVNQIIEEPLWSAYSNRAKLFICQRKG